MKRLPLLTGIAPLLVLAAACSDSPTGIDSADGTALETARPDITPVVTPLSTEETLDLLHMREEEKLARDVYDLLYVDWSLTVHDQISDSEQRHMDTMLQMVELYGLKDPVGGNPAGVFTDSSLQDLYDQQPELTREGNPIPLSRPSESTGCASVWKCSARRSESWFHSISAPTTASARAMSRFEERGSVAARVAAVMSGADHRPGPGFPGIR